MTAEHMLKRDLAYLRKAGEVWFTASHGDQWCHRFNTLNYEMFTECKRNGKPRYVRHKPLAEYGLKFEAYFTPHTSYLSDSGGDWRGFRLSAAHNFTTVDPVEHIKKFNERDVKDSPILQILVHPEWWRLTQTERSLK